MFKLLLLLIASVLPLMAAIEDDAATAFAATDTAWRAQVHEFAGGYAATIRTADAGSGFSVGERFTVVVMPTPTEVRLGVAALQLPAGAFLCNIVTGQAGTMSFENRTQLPFINGSIARLSDQPGRRLTLGIAEGITGLRVVTADLDLLPPASP
jgi:hypothetical protein